MAQKPINPVPPGYGSAAYRRRQASMQVNRVAQVPDPGRRFPSHSAVIEEARTHKPDRAGRAKAGVYDLERELARG